MAERGAKGWQGANGVLERGAEASPRASPRHLEKFCDEFADSEENKLIYTSIHRDYEALAELVKGKSSIKSKQTSPPSER